MEDVEVAHILADDAALYSEKALSMEKVEVTTLAAWFRLSLACLKTH